MEETRRSRSHVTALQPMHRWDEEAWRELRQPEQLDAFLASGRAESTLATYASQRRQFLQFCQQLGVEGEQRFSAQVLCQWIMGRSQHGYKLSTIEIGLHALGSWLPVGTLSQPDVVQALRAAARRPSAAQRRKLPILLDLLSQLVFRPAQDWREARDFAFWALAWHGMFRSGELCSLLWQDVTVQSDGLIVYVAHSKTDQAGVGQHVFVAGNQHEHVCPVKVLARLAEYVHELSGPIFTAESQGSGAVSKRTMLSRLQKAMQRLGHPKDMFGLHSFRSGGATAAAMGGMSERLIKAHGRWVSDVVRVYTCALPSEMWQVSSAMHRQ